MGAPTPTTPTSFSSSNNLPSRSFQSSHMCARNLLLLLPYLLFILPFLAEASTHPRSGHALHGALVVRDSADPGGCENLSGSVFLALPNMFSKLVLTKAFILTIQERLIVPNDKTVTNSGPCEYRTGFVESNWYGNDTHGASTTSQPLHMTVKYEARGLGGETLAAYLGTSQDGAYHSNGGHWNTLNKGMLTSYQEDTLGSGACRYEDWLLPSNLPRVALGSYKCAGAALDNPLNIYKDGAGCGMCLVVYTQQERRVAIATNECPHCPGGMDMEQQFWNILEGDGRTERQMFEWSIVPCTDIFQGGLVIVFGPDSQRYYMRFQVRLAAYPVIAMSWALREWYKRTFSGCKCKTVKKPLIFSTFCSSKKQRMGANDVQKRIFYHHRHKGN